VQSVAIRSRDEKRISNIGSRPGRPRHDVVRWQDRFADGNELQISVTGRELYSQLGDCQFMLMEFAPQSMSVVQTSLNNNKNKMLHEKCKDEVIYNFKTSK